MPPDDKERADEDWLRKTFGPNLRADLGFGFRIQFYTHIPPSLEYERGSEFQYGYEYAETGLPVCQTRGEVRDLCRAPRLGELVKVKKQKDETVIATAEGLIGYCPHCGGRVYREDVC